MEETDGLTGKEFIEEEHAGVQWVLWVLLVDFGNHNMIVGHIIKKSDSNLTGAFYLKALVLIIKLAFFIFLLRDRLSRAYLLGREWSLELNVGNFGFC